MADLACDMRVNRKLVYRPEIDDSALYGDRVDRDELYGKNVVSAKVYGDGIRRDVLYSPDEGQTGDANEDPV